MNVNIDNPKLFWVPWLGLRTMCMPELCTFISILQASANSPSVRDLTEANKLLRFATEAAKSHTWRLQEVSQLRIGAYTDAGCAVRPDGSSQGGMILCVCSEKEIDEGKMMALTTLQWHSKKLTRICRSSLSAETQAAAMAVDELEWCKIFLAIFAGCSLDINSSEALLKFGSSPLATDAKSLFDAAQTKAAGLRLSEKRTGAHDRAQWTMVLGQLSPAVGRWAHQAFPDRFLFPQTVFYC